jgi:CheY-like chemotaxis protein
VDLVDNGRQAVEFACQIQYDMILMDIQMPLMDGHEATKLIRKAEWGRPKCNRENSDSNSTFPIPPSEFDKVPIVAMTGSNLEAERDKCLNLGMNDCIGKPLFREQLLALVQRWTTPGCDKPAANATPTEEGRALARNTITSQPLDLDKALREFMGEKKVLNSLLKEFSANVRSQIKAIHHAFKRLDFTEIAKEAHCIKGGAANLTANQVAGIASALEKAAGLQQADLAGHLVDELEEKVLQLENYLQNEKIVARGVWK